MALKHLSTIFCDTILTEGTKRHSIIRAWQNIGHSGPFPALKSPFCAFIELTGEDDRFRVDLVAPDGNKLELYVGVADKHEPDNFKITTTTLSVELAPLALPMPGIYAVVISAVNGDNVQEIHRKEFGVILVERPQKAPEASDG